ncbi:MAG: RNA methyltransferase [Deltaproteobacteria bacterium HGW-Deltaproteobacteria-10]|nr:MAG: RNA methyltransferase [Deltaproteobacteria bacterium HGW-Deltaproteobacteria-10]
MTIWKRKSNILVTCPKGVAPYLQAEITALGFPVRAQLDTAIQTEGTLEDTLLLNLHLRTAQRVLYLLETFKAGTPGVLYGRLNSLPWETLIAASGKTAYFCVTSIVDNPLITDSRFVNVKVKDAIVDRIRDKCGLRPDSGPDKDKAVVHVYWKNDQASVYLDTSGERLALRGYRKIPLLAPMQETLAAAAIAASGWKGEGAFINPMCGSGTLAIEAAMIALDRAPGLLRNNYGFMFISGFPETIWQNMRKKARDTAKKELPVKIIATDIDQEAVLAAKHNAQTAGVHHLIEFHTCSYEKTPLPQDGGVIFLNPPYGERMGTNINKNQPRGKSEYSAGRKIIIRKAADRPDKSNHIVSGTQTRLETLYQNIGDFFKKTEGGYRGYIFTGNLEMIKKVGLRTKQRIVLYNGDIECRLLEYELYKGSRKNPVI